MIKLIPSIFLFFILFTASALAECVLSEIVKTNVEGNIETIKDIQKTIIPMSDSKQKCVVKFNAFVDREWHGGLGVYVYGNSMGEERACGIALNNGKQRLLERLFPQGVQAEAVLLCDEGEKVTRVSGLNGLTPERSHRLFFYKGKKCGWFIESVAEQEDIHQWTVIACEMRQNEWERVDRFMRF